MKKLNFNDGTLAQAYCTKENENKILDHDLLKACGSVAQSMFDAWFEEYKLDEAEYRQLQAMADAAAAEMDE